MQKMEKIVNKLKKKYKSFLKELLTKIAFKYLELKPLGFLDPLICRAKICNIIKKIIKKGIK